MIKSLNFDSEKLFILIRNLGLHPENVSLDFSEYDNQQEVLEKWCIDYIISDIQVDLQTLNQALSEIILDFLKTQKQQNSQYQVFIEKHYIMLNDICCFLSSSVYYSASLVTSNKIPFDYELLKETTDFKQNITNLFKYINKFEVELMLKKYKKCDYHIFHEQNFAEKFSTLATTSMYVIFLYGQSTPQWKLFQSLLSQC